MTADLLDDVDRRLDQLRHVADPAAERLAARLREQHPGMDEGDLVRLVLGHIGSGANRVDEDVLAWLTEGPPLPAWTDLDKVQAGQRFFGKWPLPIATALFCVSLPGAYAAAEGSHVLVLTSDLATNNLARRTYETGQMIFDVMDLGRASPAALQPGGQGYMTIRGVRLLHAVVRRTLLATVDDDRLDPSQRWDPAWGLPINQEDLLGTLLTFTVVVFYGMDRLGIPYDGHEADAYLHTWCVIGHLLGIQPDLLPLDRGPAEDLARAIARRHHHRSPAGTRLTATLLQHMEVSMPLGLRKLPCTLMQRMLPSPVPELLDVPPSAWWAPVIGLMAHTGPVLRHVPGGVALIRYPSAFVGRAMLRMIVDRSLEGHQPSFRIDPAVVAQLRIKTSHPRRKLRRRRREKRERQAR